MFKMNKVSEEDYIEKDNLTVVISTTAAIESKKIAKILVEEKLAACVNIFNVTSFYEWNNKLEEDAEDLLIIKTIKNNTADIVKRVKEIHSYDLPEIITLPITGGYREYLRWVEENCRRDR